jgi:hypothetical protein
MRIFLNTLFFSFFLIITSGACIAQQTLLSVSAPQYASQTLPIRGFDAFHSEFLDSLVFDKQGKALCTTQYSGFALLEGNDDNNFPVILGHGDLSFEINSEGHVIVGPGNRENLFFYRNLRQMSAIFSRKSALKESLSALGKDSAIGPVIRQQIVRQDSLLADFGQMLNDSCNYFASLILKGKLLLYSSSECRDTNSIKNFKEILSGYILSNLELLCHTDMIRQVTLQFIGMNDRVSYTPEQYNSQFLKDIRFWIKALHNTTPQEEIVRSFLNMALDCYYVTPAGSILESFPNDVLCPVLKKEAANRSASEVPFVLWGHPGTRFPMSKLKGSMILLIFVDPDCLATIPAQVMVTRYLLENNIGIPYVTVFNTSLPEKISKWLPNIGFYCDSGLDPSKTLMSYSGIEHYPAFIILDPELKVAQKFYTLPEIKTFLRTLIQKVD